MTLRRRGYLVESTFNLDADVDMIYKMAGLDKVLADLSSRDQKRMLRRAKSLSSPKTLVVLDSSRLKTKVAKEAHKVNPVEICVGVYDDGSYYIPRRKFIQVSLNREALDFMIRQGADPGAIERELPLNKDRFWSEFSPVSIKGTIYHELAHWADDSLHGRHISKALSKVRETGGQSVLRGRTRPARSPIEINAYIHSIKQVRREMGKRVFEKMSWMDLINGKAQLGAIFRGLKTDREYEVLRKDLLKRLNREGLLTRRLRKLPTVDELVFWGYV